MAADGSIIIKILGDDTGFSDVLRGLTNIAKNALDSVVAVGSQFSSSMSQVAATMGLTVQEVNSGTGAYQMLKEAAKEAGATTAFSASQAADALNYLALAGYDAEQAADALPAVLNLAAAGGLDLAYASDLATDAMSALGIEASNKNLTQFGDQMAKTASKANTSVGQLGEAILTVGGTAKSLAGGTVELNAALGVLANRGIKGAEGGIHLRNVLQNLSGKSATATKALESLGVAAYDNEGKMRSLNDIFLDLNDALGAMTDQEKSQVLQKIFNSTDLAAAQALLAGAGEEFDNLSAAIENSAGAMQNMADVQLNNLEGDMQMLNSATEGLAINIYDALEPALRGLTQAFTAVVSFVSDIAEDAPWLVTMIAGAAVAVGALVAAITVYNVVTKIAAALSLAFGTATNIALGPVALLIAAIGAMIGLVGGLNQVYKDNHKETYAVIDSSEALRKQLNDTKAAYEENSAAIQGEHDDVIAMSSALDGLMAKENQTAADKQAILSIVEQLNAAVPNLSLAYDEQTNSLTDLNTGLAVTTDAILAAAEAQVRMEQAQEDARRYAELKIEQERLQAQLEEDNARLSAQRAEDRENQVMGMSRAEGKLLEAIYADNAALEENAAEMEKLRGKVDDYAQSQSEAANATTDAQAKLADLTQQMADLETAYAEAYKAAVESVEGQFKLWEEAKEVTATSIDSINNAIQTQIDYWNSYNENLEFLKTRTGDFEGLGAVISNFADGSKESMAAVAGIVKALEEENYDAVTQMISEYLELQGMQSSVEENMADVASGYSDGAEKLQSAIDEATEEANKDLEEHAEVTQESMDEAKDAVNAYKDFYDAGVNDAQGLINGASSMTSDVHSAFYAIGQTALSAYKKAMDQHSPSKKMFESGVNDLQGLINGATSKKGALIDTYKDMAESVQDELDDYLNDSEHQIFLWGKSGGNEREIIAQYRDMMDQLHTMAESYRAMGLDDNSTEIQKLQKQWLDYSDDIEDIQEKQYKTRLSELQKALDREEITQLEYLKGLVDAQKEYLQEGTDAWESAMEDQEAAILSQVDVINGLEDDYQSALGNVKSVLSEYITGVKSDYESALRDLQKAQENMQSKLAGVGDLFSIEKNTKTGKETFSIINLQESIDAINAYGDALEGLKDRGISESLMQEVLGMSTEDATKYANELMKMTDKQFDNYLSLWEEKQTAASTIAEKFYSDDLQRIQDDYADEMTSIIAELPDEFRPLGEEAMKELSYGLQDKGAEAVAAVRDIKEQIQAELASITEMFQGAVANEVAAFSAKLEFKTNAIAEAEAAKSAKQTEAIANTIMDSMMSSQGGDVVFNLDGIEFARAAIPSWRQVEDQSPRIVSD